MSTYEAIAIMLGFGMFTISLISLVITLERDKSKGKK